MTQIDGVEFGQYQSVADVFLEACDKHAQKPAYSCMGQTLSFEDVERLTANFASYLQNHTDLEVGDRIAIQLPNVLQFPIAVFGAMRAGMVVVNTNPLYTAREMEHQFNDSGAKALLILANMAHLAEQVVPKTSIKHVIVTELADMHPFPKRLLINTVVKRVKKMVPAYSLPQAVSFRHTLALGAKKAPVAVALTLDDTAVLQYTGGTTGLSKGAQLLQKNLVSNMMQVRELIVNILDTDTEVVIAPLPLYHIYAFTVSLVMSDMGHELVLIPNPRDIPGFVKELAKYKFTAITGVNTLFNGLLNTPEFNSLDFSALKMSLGGGMAVQRSVGEEWEKVTGTRLLEGYGLTECAPLVTLCPYDQKSYSGNIGLPASSTDIRIIKDDGTDADIGDSGEMWVKGPQVMKGYYQREEDTDDILKDGWLATGDIACMDENGFFKIVDRKKDMIIVSGFNVFPNEIEEVVMMHAGVLEAAAIGVEHESTGEAVKIFVVLKDKTLTTKDLIKHCRENLTSYKVPKNVEFRDELPKTNVGKILRRELR